MVVCGVDYKKFLETDDELEKELLLQITAQAMKVKEDFNLQLAQFIAREVNKLLPKGK